jgi:hypothetical protein
MKVMRVLSITVLFAGIFAASPSPARAHGCCGPWWGYPGPYPYYYPAYGSPGYVAVPVGPPVGFADLDVEPEEAQVFVKGHLIGIADNYDGFPGYLALKPGTRTLVFRHPGFADLKVNLQIVPGGVAHVRMDMRPLAGNQR